MSGEDSKNKKEDEVIEPVPFKRVSNTNRTLNIIKEETEEEFIVIQCFERLSETFNKTIKHLLNNRIPSILIYASIIVCILGHLAFQGYLVYEYRKEKLVIAISIQLGFSIFFLLNNFSFLCQAIKQETTLCTKTPVYLLLLFSYLIMSLVVAIWVHYYNKIYCVISCILLICVANIFGISLCFGLISSILCNLLAIIEGFCRCVYTSLCSKVKYDELYHVYYYDPSKTDVMQCVICLGEFKREELVCVGKCHKTHIFHDKCLDEWFKVKLTCPLCQKLVAFY